MKNIKKKVFAVLTAVVMLIGSMNVVLAGSSSASHEFVGGSTVYYEAYCMSTYGMASTWLYVDDGITSVNVYVSMKLYVNGESNEYGIDEDYSSTINSGLATADAEISATGNTASRVESDHSAGLGGLPSHSQHLSASN